MTARAAMMKNLSNCWETPKTTRPQHSHEIRADATWDIVSCPITVEKSERTGRMAYGESLSARTTGNQQPTSEQDGVQRLEKVLVGSQATGDSKW